MKDEVNNKFKYKERTTCECGEFLHDSVKYISKKYAWGFVNFVKCDSCGSWCQSPQIASDSLKQWFDSEDYQGSDSKNGVAYVNYLGDELNRLEDARLRFKRDLMVHLPKGARVLELGCATGTLLSVMRSFGCEIVGIDLSLKFVEAAKKLNNIDVLFGELDNFDFPSNYFDSIVFFGTIGNLKNLSAYFKRFAELLKKNGQVIFNFVDADSPIVKYLYGKRFWMFTPSVNCFMTTRGVKKILNNSGFRIVSLSNDMQRPSLQKIFNHAQLKFLIPVLKYLGMDKASVPFSVPIPSVKIVRTQIRVL